MSTDISEKGLESLIVRHMTGTDGLDIRPGAMPEPPAADSGTGYFAVGGCESAHKSGCETAF